MINNARPLSPKTVTKPPFGLSPIGAVILGMSLLAVNQAYAEEESSVETLKEENAKLKQALEQMQKQLAAQTAGASATPSELTASEAGQPTAIDGDTTAQSETKEENSLLNEVLVRAKKRSEVKKVKEVPKSISAVSGEELDNYSATNVTDILKRVGNASWSYGNPRTGGYTMRGLSAGSSDQIDPSVGVVVDGISYAYSPLAAGTDFFDLESVNVTRGPQGTSGHKNTSLGEIVFTTKKPTFDSEASANVLWGQNNTVKTQAIINGAVIDNQLAWRTSFQRNSADGNYTNAFPDNPGRQTYVNTDRTFARTQFLYTPTDDFKALVSLHYQPKGTENLNGLTFKQRNPLTYRNGGSLTAAQIDALPENRLRRAWFTRQSSSYGVDEYFNFPVYSDNNGGITTSTRGANVNLDWDTWGGHKLSYIGGYKEHYFTAANDEGTPFDVSTDGGFISDYIQYSHELVLESEKGGFAEYKAGLYSFHSDNNENSRTRYGADAGAWNATAAQYNCLYSGTSCPGGLTNSANNIGEGRDLLRDAYEGLYRNTLTSFENQQNAAFGEVKWHLTEPVTLTTGVRVSHEDRRATGGIIIADQGAGAGLNPVSTNDVQLGGFNSNATTGALGANNAAQQATADALANKYFGAANYGALTADQMKLIAQAKGVRSGALGTLYNVQEADPYQDVLVNSNVSLSYKINDSYTPYVTWQHGTKPGISQIGWYDAVAGRAVSANAKPEISNSYELGLKTTLFDNTLDLNVDIFYDKISNFQQTVYVFDSTLAAQGSAFPYRSIAGNVKGVEVKGLELDASYRGIDSLTLRFAGAYNDARYSDFKNGTLPVEAANETVAAGYTGFQDNSGKTLGRAPKFTGNLSGDYEQPVFNSFIFHTNLNFNFASEMTYDLTLSDYSKIGAHWDSDFAIGLGRRDKLFDANLIVRNIFDNRYNTTKSWNSYAPNNERWIGIQFSSQI